MHPALPLLMLSSYVIVAISLLSAPAAAAFGSSKISRRGGTTIRAGTAGWWHVPVQEKRGGVPVSKQGRFPRSSLDLSSGDSEKRTEVEERRSSDVVVTDIPSVVEQPVLRQVYPAMLDHVKEFGHPNIPLGTTEGRKCSTLRRLYKENKLTKDETELLENMGFRFISFDDIYFEADFEDMFHRLVSFEEEHKNNYQVPKKYAPNMELGAWVTNIRRLGCDKVKPEHREKLDGINFVWKSTRKCGSSFMKNYRDVRATLGEISDDGGSDEVGWANKIVSSSVDMKRWVVAQRGAWKKGNLSDARIRYLDQLTDEFGLTWREDAL